MLVEESEELVSAAEAARILGVSRQAITLRQKHGSLVPARVAYRGGQRRPLFRRADVEALRRDRGEDPTV